MKQWINTETKVHMGYYIVLTLLTVWVIFFYSLIGTIPTLIAAGVLFIVATGFLFYQTTYLSLFYAQRNVLPEYRTYTVQHLAMRKPITDLFLRTYQATKHRSHKSMKHKIRFFDTDLLLQPISKRLDIQFVTSIDELRECEKLNEYTKIILVVESPNSMVNWTSEDELDAVLFNDQRGNIVGLFYEQYTTLRSGNLKGLYRLFIDHFDQDIVLRATGTKRYLIQFFRYFLNHKINLKKWARAKIRYDNLIKQQEYNKWKELDDEFEQ